MRDDKKLYNLENKTSSLISSAYRSLKKRINGWWNQRRQP